LIQELSISKEGGKTLAKLEQVATPTVKVKPVSPWRDAWTSFRKNKIALAGSVIVLLFIIIALFAPVLAPYDHASGKLVERFMPPSSEHWFGTDDFGRDVLSRVIIGARMSLWIGFTAVIGSVIVGSILGVLAGFYGRFVDTIISRLFDIMLAFPSILLAIAIVAIIGPSLENAMFAIAIVNVPNFGRLIRSKVLSVKEEEYITAARAIGMSDFRILTHHIIPNSITPIIVQGTLAIATAIIEVAALSFLGLGAQSPDVDWGKMLDDSRAYLVQAPWTMIFPGLAIMLTVLGFNLMGDGLRDALDPKLKQ
jgi:peptide/nickel transport system permease protein